MLLYLVWLASLRAYCTYTQHYWLNGTGAPDFCGTECDQLMRLESSQMRQSGAIYWLLAVHQFYAAYWNVQLIDQTYEQNATDLNPLDDYYDVMGVNLSLQTLQDALQRSCGNVSAWGDTAERNPTLNGALLQLFRFNEGLVAPGACPDEYAQTFAFETQPDLFVANFLIYPLNEARVTTLFHTQTLLFGLCGLAYFFLVPALLFYVLLKNNANRQYSIVNESDLCVENELETEEAANKMTRNMNEYDEIDLDYDYTKV